MNKKISTSNSTLKALKLFAVPVIVYSQCLSAYAQADQNESRDTIYFTLPPSPEVLASHLFGAEKPRTLTRSLSFKSSSASAPADTERSVAMPILFHFGKTTITTESKPFLDNVGKMLVEPDNIAQRLFVEGHTDSVGGTQFNHALSEQRAKAIKEYLVSNFGVNSDRLVPVGKGESLLYNQQYPESGENRRVEFLPLASS